MKRLERLTALLSYLQSRRHTGIKDLESKFQVSERTVFRDIKALHASGVPIGFDKDKGYFILDRHFLPPLAFTLDEAKSFIFIEQLAKKYTDKDIFQHFSSALEKIKNKLSDAQLTNLESLASKVGAYVNPDYDIKYLNAAEQACDKKQLLQISYQDFNGKKTLRKVEPIGITFYSQSWHLIAFCQLRDDYRDFVLSRIGQLTILEAHIQRKHLSLTEYIQKIENENID